MICTKCKEDKSESEFYLRSGRSKRQKQTMPECKVCFKKRADERAKENRISLILEYGNKCQRCGYNKYPVLLHFHHIDPSTKKFNISKRSGNSMKNLRIEADKCILLCPTCHSEVHFEMKL